MKPYYALILSFSVACLICSAADVVLANPCEEDAKTFCSGVQPGGGRIINCLKDHSKEISQGCYDCMSGKENVGSSGVQGSEGGSENTALKPACMGDARSFCSGVLPGEIDNCLKDHYKQISQECYDSLADTAGN